MMRIRPNVYFRKYGTYTYIRSVEQARDYLLNESAYDILDFIEKNRDADLVEMLNHLAEIYEDFDAEENAEGIQEFVQSLMECEILEEVPGSGVEQITEETKPDHGVEQSAEEADRGEEQITEGTEADHGEAQSTEETEPDHGVEMSIKEMIQEYCCREHQLMTVCLELTYRCNERCVHCYIDDPTRESLELQFEDYKKVLDELREMGCMSILLTGGEPTLHKDFLRIARYAKQLGIIVDIYTNGLFFSEELLDELVELKPNSVSFSLYGSRAEVHDAVTLIPGSFEKSLKSMMMCKCAGLDVYIKTVVMKPTAADYENLRRLGKRLNIDVISSTSVMDTHKGKCGERFRLMDEDEYQRILEIEYQYGDYPAEAARQDRSETICFSGLNALSVDPFGAIHPCNAHPMVLGNVKSDSLKEIWEHSQELHSLRAIRFNQLSEKCGSCEDKNWCGLCMGSAIKENGKLAPCSDTCMIARANHRAYEVSLQRNCESI